MPTRREKTHKTDKTAVATWQLNGPARRRRSRKTKQKVQQQEPKKRRSLQSCQRIASSWIIGGDFTSRFLNTNRRRIGGGQHTRRKQQNKTRSNGRPSAALVYVYKEVYIAERAALLLFGQAKKGVACVLFFSRLVTGRRNSPSTTTAPAPSPIP